MLTRIQQANRPLFLFSDHHCPVWREALLVHGSDHRPVAVVYFHRRWGAAVGTGQGETMNVDEFHGGKKTKQLCFTQGCHHNNRHGDESSCLQPQTQCGTPL